MQWCTRCLINQRNTHVTLPLNLAHWLPTAAQIKFKSQMLTWSYMLTLLNCCIPLKNAMGHHHTQRWAKSLSGAWLGGMGKQKTLIFKIIFQASCPQRETTIEILAFGNSTWTPLLYVSNSKYPLVKTGHLTGLKLQSNSSYAYTIKSDEYLLHY